MHQLMRTATSRVTTGPTATEIVETWAAPRMDATVADADGARSAVCPTEPHAIPADRS